MERDSFSKLTALNDKIEKEFQTLVADYSNLNSVENQISGLSSEVNSYINEVLKTVNGNQDIAQVNQLLVNSLIEISKFISDKPRVITNAKLKINSKIQAYQNCSEMIVGMIGAPPVNEANENKEEIVSTEKPEENLQTEEDLKRDKDKDSSAMRLGGGRKTGTRPEKLKDIRNKITKNDETENSQEDI